MSEPGEKLTTIRTFLAVDVPDAVREQARAAQDALRLQYPGGSVTWVDPACFHITVKFLGDVAGERVSELREALSGLWSGWPIRVRTGGLGQFPERGRPAVLWLGVTEGAAELDELARRVDVRALELGFKSEERPYHAHLTLGRVKRIPSKPNAAAAHRPEAPSAPPFEVKALTLYKSTLSSHGPTYEALASLR